MNKIAKNLLTVAGGMLLILFLSSYVIYSSKPKKHKKIKVLLPNDWQLISKYEGDPSLLNAYMRNDSIFLNFEGY